VVGYPAREKKNGSGFFSLHTVVKREAQECETAKHLYEAVD